STSSPSAAAPPTAATTRFTSARRAPQPASTLAGDLESRPSAPMYRGARTSQLIDPAPPSPGGLPESTGPFTIRSGRATSGGGTGWPPPHTAPSPAFPPRQ